MSTIDHIAEGIGLVSRIKLTETVLISQRWLGCLLGKAELFVGVVVIIIGFVAPFALLCSTGIHAWWCFLPSIASLNLSIQSLIAQSAQATICLTVT